MSSRGNILLILVFCLWPIALHLAIPQAKSTPLSMVPSEVNTTTQKNLFVADMKMNQLCHIAADFGYDAAKEGVGREQMHQELREILK